MQLAAVLVLVGLAVLFLGYRLHRFLRRQRRPGDCDRACRGCLLDCPLAAPPPPASEDGIAEAGSAKGGEEQEAN